MRLLLHAPNVNTGGGVRLMQQLLSIHPLPVTWAQLDARTRGSGLSTTGLMLHWVKRTLRSRILAELRLWWVCRPGDVVLCFHGLPPLLPLPGRVVVFVQNRLLTERGSLAGFPSKTRIRLLIERAWIRALHRRCSRYIVQTPSMARSLRSWLRSEEPISVTPFASAEPLGAISTSGNALGRFDFVYVASGEAHKNHWKLLEAWHLLAQRGHRPSLALTLDGKSFPALCSRVDQLSDKYGLAVSNLGILSSEAVDALYRVAGALIYPSTSESLGLPLIEAARRGLPILAPELDYVRDVVEPAHTFDPNSPVSIARAVMRFLGVAEVPMKMGTVAGFLEEVLR